MIQHSTIVWLELSGWLVISTIGLLLSILLWRDSLLNEQARQRLNPNSPALSISNKDLRSARMLLAIRAIHFVSGVIGLWFPDPPPQYLLYLSLYFAVFTWTSLVVSVVNLLELRDRIQLRAALAAKV